MDKRYLLFLVILLSIGLGGLLWWHESQLALASFYGLVGMWLIWISLQRRRLAGLGAGLHYVVVAWRAGLLAYVVDASWWPNVHAATIALAALLVVIDATNDRLRDGGKDGLWSEMQRGVAGHYPGAYRGDAWRPD